MTVRHWNDAQVEAAIAAAVARERERCAWLCDQLGLRLTEWELTNVALNCANAIRALPDGGATTAEPQPDYRPSQELLDAAVKAAADFDAGEVPVEVEFAWCIEAAIIAVAPRIVAECAASSVGGATTGTTDAG